MRALPGTEEHPHAAEPADAATSVLVSRLRDALGALRHDQPR